MSRLPKTKIPHKITLDGEPLIPVKQINARNKELFEIIKKDYQNIEFFLVLYITDGSVMNTYHLLDVLRDDGVFTHAVHAKSFKGTKRKKLEINLNDLHGPLLQDRDVLLVDDIVDSGNTMAAVVKALKELNPTCRVKTYSLLRKPDRVEEYNERRRKRGEEELIMDYVGFDIDSETFAIGRGMDYYGFGRVHKCIFTFDVWAKRFAKDFNRAEELRKQTALEQSEQPSNEDEWQTLNSRSGSVGIVY